MYLVPHDEVMGFAALQKCRPVEVLLEGRNTGVPVLFAMYKSCCIVWMPSRSLVFLAVWAFHAVDAYSKHGRTSAL